MNGLIIRLLCVALLFVYVHSYASYFASEPYCSVTLAVNQVLMGASVQSGNTRSVVVKRNGVALSSGALYNAGETLSVSISSSDVEYAIQVASGGATFSGGACNQARIADGSGTLTMPSSGTVVLNGGSASSEGTVKMMSDFVLNCCQSKAPTRTPTARPTSRSPTLVPSVTPSCVPSVAPSQAPSELPTISGAPVTFTPTSLGTPSVSPTLKPSAIPSIAPSTLSPTVAPSTVSPTVAPSESPSAVPTYLSKTFLTYSISQILYNITVSTIESNLNSTEGLAYAMLISLEHFQSPTEVTLTSYQSYNSTVNGIISSTPAVMVVYAVTYLLEDTGYGTISALQDALTISANLVSNSNLFLMSLSVERLSALRSITSTSANSLVLTSTVVEKSVAPTHSPTRAPFETDDRFYNGALTDKIVTGVLVGLFGVILSVSLLSYYVHNHVTILARGASFMNVPAVFAIVLAVVSLILVSAWATKLRVNDMQYLGVPNWKTNVFAWHPVLMVAGFFLCQVTAISDWVFFTKKEYGKAVHVFFHTAGLTTMIAALCAVVKYKRDQGTNHVNSMHSWIGVGAVIAFCSNYIFGCSMGLLTAFAPNSPIHKSYNLLFTHRVLGLTSLGLCTAAIVAGIMDQLPQGACFYDSSSPFQADFDPAENYPYVRGSCQIAHGLGITVIAAAAFTVLAVVLRERVKARTTMVSIGGGDGGEKEKSHVVEFFY